MSWKQHSNIEGKKPNCVPNTRASLCLSCHSFPCKPKQCQFSYRSTCLVKQQLYWRTKTKLGTKRKHLYVVTMLFILCIRQILSHFRNFGKQELDQDYISFSHQPTLTAFPTRDGNHSTTILIQLRSRDRRPMWMGLFWCVFTHSIYRLDAIIFGCNGN